MGAHLLLSSVCYSLSKGREVVVSSCLALLTNCILNAACVFGLGLGAKSIAIATAVSSLLAALYLGSSLKKEQIFLPVRALFYRFGLALLLGTVLSMQLHFWFKDPSFAILEGRAPGSISGMNSFVRLAFGGSSALILGYITSRICNIPEWDLLGALRRLFQRRSL
jgi:Na+-driven multidrug efflux pump